MDSTFGLTAQEQAALRLLTHGDDKDYVASIERVVTNPLAGAVKLADLGDNLDVTRLDQVTERNAKRITKYLRSLGRLTAPSSAEGAR